MPLLPREGLTPGALFALFHNAALQPLLNGSLLYVLMHHMNTSFLSLTKTRALVKILKVLFAVSVLRKADNTLSKMVMNNWVFDQWRNGEEIVLVTGGTSGIGEIMVKNLARWSKVIVVLDLAPPKTALPSNAVFFKVDISSSAEISAAAVQIRSEHGSPSILVNNAGIGCPHPLLNLSEETIRRTFDVNLISHFLLVKEFLPAMVEANHGHVVTVASLASFLSISPTITYSCTKVGALAFHEGLANELKVRYNAPKVRTTIVHPSFIRTPLVTKMLENPRFKGFILEPETVADAVVKNLLASESAQIMLPGRVAFWSLLRSFPLWLQYALRNREGFKIKMIQGV